MKDSLRHAWRDGTTAVVMEPLDFVARLVALVPAPRRHQLRYHGTLAPNAAWRKLIVPKPPEEASRGGGCGAPAAGEALPSRTRLSWAELIRRVFETAREREQGELGFGG